MERAQVRWKVTHQACEKERANVPAESSRNNQGIQDSEARKSGEKAQSSNQGLGELSPEPSSERNLLQGRQRYLETALVVGLQKTSREISRMVEVEILYA